jgi:TatD DNase family protein
VNLYDAHNHLHDLRLAAHHQEILPALAGLGIRRAVVNGTCPADWDAVAALAREHAWVLPSFGLHPWYVAERTSGWLETLRSLLSAFPRAGVGEIGLDRWIEGHDDEAQAEVFTAQLALATELNRPVTIHCLRAWGALAEILRDHPLPARGFLIHAYGGSAEMMREFAQLGGYFSFNAYFLHERKATQRAVFQAVPADRLLIETDAPSMAPPDDQIRHPLMDDSGEPLNHPANLELAYTALAGIRGVSVDALARTVESNFTTLFGPVTTES